MIASILIARFLGIYLLSLGAALLIRREQFPRVIREFFDNDALVFLSAVLSLIFGLGIILFHNVWGWNWSLPITIIGYLAFFKGLIRLWFPDHVKRIVYDYIGTRFVIALSIVAMLLAVYFAHHGFLAQH